MQHQMLTATNQPRQSIANISREVIAPTKASSTRQRHAAGHFDSQNAHCGANVQLGTRLPVAPEPEHTQPTPSLNCWWPNSTNETYYWNCSQDRRNNGDRSKTVFEPKKEERCLVGLTTNGQVDKNDWRISGVIN
jgi:hypothetical protein